MGNCSNNNNTSSSNGHQSVNSSNPDESGLSVQRHKGETFQGTNYIYLRASDTQHDRKGTVVCVHGIGSFGADFEHIAQRLQQAGYNVLRYDLLGRGFSAFPTDNRFDEDAHVNQLRQLIEHLGICPTATSSSTSSKYHIIGHSMGGALVSLYAARFAAEIASITLLSPAGLMDLGPLRLIRCTQSTIGYTAKHLLVKPTQKSAWQKGFTSPSSKIAEAFVAEMTDINRINNKHFDAFWATAMQFPLSGIESELQLLSKATSSTADGLHIHVVWGEEDDVVPFNTDYEKWKRALLNSNSDNIRFTSFPRLKHAFMLDDPQTVLPSIEAFIDAADGRANTSSVALVSTVNVSSDNNL